ncbi:MAG TPA: branched-chain amino acid ABC transporter ATP-binding protein/permease [Acetobacteraceae bacterium]|nr:branched-chain amino acid ABC transporter ATP-binding protein/permease [Acetobacteraceae bacterium]
MTQGRHLLAVVVAVLAIVAVPGLLPAFYVTLFGYVGLAALVALGLVLLTGISGQTSFGQASFVGLAAYATTLLTKFADMPSVVGLLAGLAVTGLTAWLLGLITARLSGHFLALVSVAWGLSFFSLFGTLPWLHGFNGIGNIPPMGLGGLMAESRRIDLAVIIAAVALLMVMSANLLDSRMGRAIRTLNGARLMGESVGIDTVRLSRTVFVIAALYAGLSGFLFAHFQRFISPTPFSLGASIDYLFMVIIGGAEWLWGAPLGAAIVVVLRDQFNDWVPRLTGQAGNYEALVFAIVVIVLLQRAPEGLLALFARAPRRPPRRPPPSSEAAKIAPPAVAAAPVRVTQPGPELLALDCISRRFGGLLANQDVSFAVHAGEIVALIGPNGAGKTTLFNVISGVLEPSGGRVRLFGETSSHEPTRRIAARGLARTFQHVKLLPSRSVLENVALGAHLSGRAGVLRAMLRLDRSEEASILAEARVQAARVGLDHVLERPAGDLPLGQQRVVEIARALCLRPRLLLLDEPAAGLRLAEKQNLAALLRQLRAENMGVLLVEHDMDFVMQLADRVVVMDFGQKIAEGPPERVQADPAVMEAYLGGVV